MGYDDYILYGIGAISLLYVASGWIWLTRRLASKDRPQSFKEVTAQANASPYWYIVPFSKRTKRIWIALVWVAGILWLIAGFHQRHGS
jgi:hypothetical protein